MSDAGIQLPVIDCTDCGACCTTCAIPPYNLGAILTAPAFIRRMVADAIVNAKSGDQCVAYDATSKRCTIYPDRPSDCRDFKVGGDACLAARREAVII